MFQGKKSCKSEHIAVNVKNYSVKNKNENGGKLTLASERSILPAAQIWSNVIFIKC